MTVVEKCEPEGNFQKAVGVRSVFLCDLLEFLHSQKISSTIDFSKREKEWAFASQ